MKLEKGVPIPPTANAPKYKPTMAAMEVGDSFVCEGRRRRNGRVEAPSGVRDAAHAFRYKLAVRQETAEPLTVRVWRVS